jgi:hypothetical protein
MNPILMKIASINGASRGKKKWDKSKKIDLSHTVNPIDLFSNQILEFLENLVDKMP